MQHTSLDPNKTLMSHMSVLAALTRAAVVNSLRFTLTEGRHRQIRRMCDLVGWQATAIKRVRIGSLRLGGLKIGNWATLPEATVKAISQPPKQGAAHLHSTTPPLPLVAHSLRSERGVTS